MVMAVSHDHVIVQWEQAQDALAIMRERAAAAG